MNWDNCNGFWEYAVAFGLGAAGGATTAALAGTDGGASFWAITGTAALTNATIAGANSVIAQTGENFSGMDNVSWGQVGKSSFIGGVSGFAGSSVGYWATNSSMLVNGINSPILRSAVVSPLASGAGHIAGGTTVGLFQGQSLETSFTNSFDGIGQNMLLGTAIGITTTVGLSYANKISPWTGKSLQAQPLYDYTPDPLGDNIKLYRGTTGSEGKGGALFLTTDPNYAATFVKNGGQVIEITMPRSTFQQMQWNGVLQPLNGVHTISGTGAGEFVIYKTDLINQMLSHTKTF
jgi:hypothetical protein